MKFNEIYITIVCTLCIYTCYYICSLIPSMLYFLNNTKIPENIVNMIWGPMGFDYLFKLWENKFRPSWVNVSHQLTVIFKHTWTFFPKLPKIVFLGFEFYVQVCADMRGCAATGCGNLDGLREFYTCSTDFFS